MQKNVHLLTSIAAFVIGITPVRAQLSSTAAWAATAQNRYQIHANVTYLVENNYEDKLDIYERRDAGLPPEHLHVQR